MTNKHVTLLESLDEQKSKGELYVPCPRCEGRCEVSAITKMGDGFGKPTAYQNFICPCCYGTAEAEIDNAIEWVIGEVENIREKDFNGWEYIEQRWEKLNT